MLAAAVGEQDEGDALGLEVGERVGCAWDRVRAAEKDAIDAVTLLAVMGAF